ncbi:MAG: hypothetical protein ACI32C_00580 [Candidatus Enteromonas sp.]
MPEWAYVLIAVLLIAGLLILFFVSFVLYVKTPAPAGCEKTYGPNCDQCDQASCQFYHFKEQALEKTKEEEKPSEEQSEGSSSKRKE